MSGISIFLMISVYQKILNKKEILKSKVIQREEYPIFFDSYESDKILDSILEKMKRKATIISI